MPSQASLLRPANTLALVREAEGVAKAGQIEKLGGFGPSSNAEAAISEPQIPASTGGDDPVFVVASSSLKAKRVIRERNGIFIPFFGEVTVVMTPQLAREFLAKCQIPRLVLSDDEAYCTLSILLGEFAVAEPRIRRIATADNRDHAAKLCSKARAFVNALKEKKTAPLCRDDEGHNPFTSLRGSQTFCEQLRVIEELEARLICTREEIESELDKPKPDDGSALDAFVRRPLANAWARLTGRRPGKTARRSGRFPRFGARFFALAGHPVECSTIASAIKSGTARRRTTRRGARG